VARGAASVTHGAAARERMEAPRAVVERLAAGEEPVYGVNPGVGLLADVRIPRGDLDRLQRNVLRSHAAGVGDPLRGMPSAPWRPSAPMCWPRGYPASGRWWRSGCANCSTAA